MQYRTYGQTGIQVSALGFGAGRFPVAKRDFDLDQVMGTLQRAFDLGVNYVDTGEFYSFGRAEIAIGRAIKGRRKSVYVSTKVSYACASGNEWEEHLKGCLQRLDVETIDFYHHHNLKWQSYQAQSYPGGPIERCREAQREGRIRQVCFSSHDKPDNIRRLIDTGEFAGILVQYNLLDRANEEVIAYAAQRGLGVAIMGPVGGGLLAAPSPQIRGMVSGAKSTPEIALRFVLSNPHVSLALSGMNTLEMVEQNVATANREEPLSAVERAQLLDALQEIRRASDLYCTGCGYCMPCPNGVDIPANLRAMNDGRLWGLHKHARSQYIRLGKERKWHGTRVRRWAEACVECGECEPKCPQQIPIRERLREAAAALGTK